MTTLRVALAPCSSRWDKIGDDHQSELALELGRRRLAMVRDPADITVEDLLATQFTRVRQADVRAQFGLR
jgi:UDP-N-acetylglucosamine transferase subunit ALG13